MAGRTARGDLETQVLRFDTESTGGSPQPYHLKEEQLDPLIRSGWLPWCCGDLGCDELSFELRRSEVIDGGRPGADGVDAAAVPLSDEASSITGALLDVVAGDHVEAGSWPTFLPHDVDRLGGAPTAGLMQ